MSNTIGEINYNQKSAQKCAVRETTEKSINSLFQRNIITKEEKDNLLQKYLRGEVTFGDDGLTAEEAQNFTRENLEEINKQSQVVYQAGGAKTSYIVQAGDTPEVIAKKLGLSGDEAKNFARKVKAQAINDGVYYRYGFQAGDIIVLPGDFQDKIDKMSANNEYAKNSKDINEDYTQKRNEKTTEKGTKSENAPIEQPKTQSKDKVIAKGGNGYYVTKDKDGNFHYFNSKGKECTEAEFKKYCPSIHKSIENYKRVQASKKAGKPFVTHRNTADIKADATKIASELFLEIDGWGSDNNNTRALLKKITPENVAFVVEAYKTAKGKNVKDFKIKKISYNKENSSHKSLAQSINDEVGLGLDDIKNNICKNLVFQAKKIGLQGIYFSAYQNINNIDDLDKWIENVSAKIRTEMKRTDTAPVQAIDKNARSNEKINSPAYKEAGIVGIKQKYDAKGNVTESVYTYKDGKVVREYTDPKRGRVRELLKAGKTQKTTETKIMEPVPMKISLPADARAEEKAFAKALEDNKAKLMKLLGIDNDTYNKLAKLALAIAKHETDFGHGGEYRSYKYPIGKIAPDTPLHAWSYGPTQIKFEMQKKDAWIKDKFDKLGLTKGTDLYDMANSAMATMVVLAQNNNIIKSSPRYQKGMEAARGSVLTENGSEIKNGHLTKTGHTKSWVNTVTDEDALYYFWNGGAAEILDGTMEPERNKRVKDVRIQLERYKVVENKAKKASAMKRIQTAKELTQPKFNPTETDGKIGSVMFMPKMYTNNVTNTKAEVDILKTSLSNNNKINEKTKNLLLQAVENGEIGFEFGLTKQEADALTQKDVELMLSNLTAIKSKISQSDVNFSDGIDSTEASTLRNKYQGMIRNYEFNFKKNYLKSHLKSVPLSLLSKYDQKHLMLETPINNQMQWRNDSWRHGFEGKVQDRGVNSAYTSEASHLLAQKSQKIALTRNSGGHCLQAVRDALVDAEIIKNPDKRKDQTVGKFSDFTQGTSRGAVRFFLDHPDAFEEVRMVKDGNYARQINSTDLPSLPAGYIVLWVPGDDFIKGRKEAEPGHISITNGYGQAYADETDNLDWGNYRGLGVDKKDASGKGEHGTFRVFRLTDKWKVENGKLKFEG